jgi:triphosphoribosyl-dephospho-CoA synthase
VSEPLSIGLCAQVACILDVVTFKPGNVSFAYSFADMTAFDFLLSAAAIAPVLDQAPLRRVGETILDCIRETRKVTSANTNLGIVLLLAPLANVQPHLDLRGGVMRALMRLDVADARAAYEAIRLAQPGGLGTVAEQDVSDEPTVNLREAMGLAADRDLVARQYVNDFEQVFEGATILREELRGPDCDVTTAVIRLHLKLLAEYPDSLIARRFGHDAAKEVARRARQLLESPAPGGLDPRKLGDLHVWFLGKGGRPQNPGTTADLVTASLFVALRQNIIQLPLPSPIGRPPG